MCSAVLAHMVLKERLNVFGIVGCMLCIVGSITIVLHAPEEQPITSLLQVWRLALQPGKPLHKLPPGWNRSSCLHIVRGVGLTCRKVACLLVSKPRMQLEDL